MASTRKTNNMKPKLVLLLLFAGMAFLAKASPTATTDKKSTHKADILGGVYSHDSKRPLSSVTVTVYSADKKEKVVFTDAEGLYTFDDLKAGIYKFVFEKDGYKRVTREKIVVQPDAGVQLNVEMSQRASFEFIPGPFHFTDLE